MRLGLGAAWSQAAIGTDMSAIRYPLSPPRWTVLRGPSPDEQAEREPAESANEWRE